jgi:hypothetical protein
MRTRGGRIRSLFFLLLLPLRFSHGELSPEEFSKQLSGFGIKDPAAESALNELYESRSFFDNPSVCNGRLTTESGQPISTTNRTSQGTIYFTPYQGQSIALWGPSRWKLYRLTELSLALSVANNRNYDIFIYNNAGTLTLERSLPWTDNFNRAGTLKRLDGVLVSDSDDTRRYLGTIRGTGVNITEDSETRRFVWNNCNRVDRTMSNSSSTSHTYASTTYRYFNNSNTNRVQFVIGESQGYSFTMTMQTGAGSIAGLGVSQLDPPSVTTEQFALANYSEVVSLTDTQNAGYYFIAVLEAASSGTVTFSSYSLYGKLRN